MLNFLYALWRSKKNHFLCNPSKRMVTFRTLPKTNPYPFMPVCIYLFTYVYHISGLSLVLISSWFYEHCEFVGNRGLPKRKTRPTPDSPTQPLLKSRMSEWISFRNIAKNCYFRLPKMYLMYKLNIRQFPYFDTI